MTKVTIDRELLEQVASEFEHDNDRYMLGRELRKILDAPRQPEGEGLEVVGFSWLDTAHFRRKIPVHCIDEQWVALCRLSDHQRAIAELREECSFLKDCQENAMLHMTGLVTERDTLRQQRNKLAGLLRMVRQDGWYHPLEDHEIAQIDAALAEVKPCQESPQPAAT